MPEASLSPLKRALLAVDKMQARLEAVEREKREPIAVVGMSGRFPGAESLDAFWQILRDGVDAVTEVPAERWEIEELFNPDPDSTGTVTTRWGGFLADVDQFDPAFFGIAPREAVRMDPQQRLLLEVAYEALEAAGAPLERLAGSNAGVFIGAISSAVDYNWLQCQDHTSIDTYTASGTAHSIFANRLSYLLDLRGPSLTVDTACSSSLTAIHLAVRSLRSRECDLALAGGVHLLLAPESTIALSRMRMMAPDGRCKTFDASADGFVRGEGCGLIVLKRLSDAVADGDPILALIRGSAVNQDGSTNGITAPNGLAQQAVVRQALEDARVAPHAISYVETHGTGTALGDPIEVEALAEVIGQTAADAVPCVLGAVKTNIGHLEAAAGIAGIIKTVLALRHGHIPPNLHFNELNPHISLDGTRFTLPTEEQPWPEGVERRYAGVSSFGFGGTNAHIILEGWQPGGEPGGEASERPALAATHRGYVLPLTARSEGSLRALAQEYIPFLPDEADALHDVCYTAAARRTHHDLRLVAEGDSRPALIEALEACLSGGGVAGRRSERNRRALAFVFSGQGAQWSGMGRDLLAHEPTFRTEVERIDALLHPYTGWSLLDELNAEGDASRLDETEVAQPAIFAFQVGLVALWRSWGIEPDAVVGHSVGEVAAAYVGGALQLEDAVRLIYHRGRLMQQATGLGKMAAVGLSENDVRALLDGYDGRLAIAAVNGPASTVLSGEAEALEAVIRPLADRGVFARMLPVNYAFHSPQVRPFGRELGLTVRDLRPQPSTVPVYSTVAGRRQSGEEFDASYWARNVNEPVRFAAAVRALADDGHTAFLEVGPHAVLTHAVAETLEEAGGEGTVIASMRRDQSPFPVLRRALGALFAQGFSVDWEAFYPGGRPVPLPSYPWQRSRFWLQPTAPQRPAAQRKQIHPLLGARIESPVHIYESVLSREGLAYLADHRIFDTAILPMAAFVEVATAAVKAVTGAASVLLEDLVVQEPLVFGDDRDRILQVAVLPAQPGRYALQIFSSASGSKDAWVLHVTATASDHALEKDDMPVSLKDIRARCAETIGTDTFYAGLIHRGSTFGSSFKAVAELQRGEGEALGHVVLPASAGDTAGYHLHPSLLDGGLQVLIAAVFDADELEAGTDAYLPFSIERFHFSRPAGGAVWSHATVRAGEGGGADTLSVDIDLIGDDGQHVARIEGLKLKRASQASLLRSLQTDVDDALYEVRWTPQEAPAAPATADPSQWLILADRGGAGAALAARLRAVGDTCALVFPGDGFAQGADGYTASPHRSADLEQVIEAVRASGTLPLRGVVHLWSLDAEAFEARQNECGSALHLAQALLAETWPAMPRLWFVTRGSATVQDDLQAVGPAALWGLRRSLDREHPGLLAACIDLDPHGALGDNDALLHELQAPADGEREVAFRAHTRFVPRLARHEPVAHAEPPPVRLEIARRGVLDNLAYRPTERRSPGPGEVEIRVHATGLNFRDVLNALGTYPGDAGALGSECAGVVTAVGGGVDAFEVGDPVFGMVQDSFRTYAIGEADLLTRKPTALSFAEVATIPITFLTSYYALHHLGGMRAGDRVLIHAAAGGVGMAAVQLALRAGAEVFGTAGSPEKRALLTSLGVHHVMDSRSLDFAGEVRGITEGEGVDLVLNSLAGDFIEASVSALAPDGHFLEIGKTDIWDAERMAAERPGASYSVIYLGEVAEQQPALIHTLLAELLEAFQDGSLAPLPHRVFSTADVVEAFRYMAQARHVGKVVIADPKACAVAAPVRPDATYLVTGGLGGLGLRVVAWLVEEGARHVAVLGRRAPSDKVRATLDTLEAMGAHVYVYQGDVSERDDVTRVIADIAQHRPPLGGVVHAAGVRDDGLFVDQTEARFDAVMQPKVEGAWHLHDATSGVDLDFFVLFAAAAGLTGNPGQTGYTAANAALDALAQHRHARGLPALSIDWGAWDEVGMVAEMAESDRERLLAQGFRPLAPDEAVRTIGELLKGTTAQVAVLPMQWASFARQFPEGRLPGLFAEVAGGAGTSGVATSDRGSEPPLLQQLDEAAMEDRPVLLQRAVRRAAARILGLDASVPIDGQRPLRDLGLDSLMAVELRNALSALLETRLHATLLFDYPTLDTLFGYLADDILHLRGPEPEHPSLNGAADVAALSDEEAEALLMAELASLNKE